VAADRFLVARNPNPGTSLPYLLSLPIDGGVTLKAREPWPVGSRVYCHPLDGDWPPEPELIEQVPVRHCRRRGSAIDLLLDRPRNNRSQFVFTRSRGREMIFWQTAKTARAARPGTRVPTRRPPGIDTLHLEVDTRERYPYRFAGRPVKASRTTLPAGDYAVCAGERLLAAVERKTGENLASSLSDGSLALQMGELASLPSAAVVVETSYSRLISSRWAPPGWLADVLARLQVRYPSVPIVFLESRKLAEEWTYRFLAAAASELSDP
jgi:ERCC4 domain